MSVKMCFGYRCLRYKNRELYFLISLLIRDVSDADLWLHFPCCPFQIWSFCSVLSSGSDLCTIAVVCVSVCFILFPLPPPCLSRFFFFFRVSEAGILHPLIWMTDHGGKLHCPTFRLHLIQLLQISKAGEERKGEREGGGLILCSLWRQVGRS